MSSRVAGFTLVEMLVAVTLVLIMMTMFAQIFQMAGASISKQRGLAENDQRSRTLQTIIKADLDKRTFRWVYPFAANEDVSSPESYIGKRQGFFYVSENNPTNKVDDVLHLTIASTMTSRNKDTSPYYGKALNLTGFSSLNEPDADDAQSSINNTGLSTVAEVVYFVRNGNLYRRQVLVREPLPTFSTSPQPTNPNLASNNDLFDAGSGALAYPTANSFWNDFDYAAYFDVAPSTAAFDAHFLGTNHLDNSGKVFNTVALGNPMYRFGFSPGATGPGLQGRAKEYSDSSTAATFIGRFTMEECSKVSTSASPTVADPTFRYPQGKTLPNGNIPTDPTLALTVDTVDGHINGPEDFGQGVRRGEDLLLSNVHGFDVQVWDELAQSFVNIGDPALGASSADYAPGNRYSSALPGTVPSPTYGPRINEDSTINAINAVFDTWHPYTNLATSNDPATSPSTATGQTLADDPPFRPTYFRPAAISGGGGAFDKPSWQPNYSTVNVGDIYFPSGPPGAYQMSPPFPTATYKGRMPYGAPFYYRCISAPVGGGATGSTEPAWPLVDSVKVPDNNLVWQAVDNRKPLKAIKIEIRFVDPSTQQMRQLTLIQSLVD